MRWRTLRLCFLLNCVYFSPFPVLFYVFFCPFISFFYPFPPFYLFPALLLSFYILIHLLFVLFYPFSVLFRFLLFLNHLFLIFYSYKAFFVFISLYSLLPFILALSLLLLSFIYLFYPCSCLLFLCVPFYLCFIYSYSVVVI